MSTTRPEVTVVICSVGRPDALDLCIDGLSHLEDVAFEVVVVLGPGAATSADALAERAEVATIVSSPARNLSLSRNLGADVARGNLIAFIDDDAYPSERWLAELVPAFADPEVGAVGGETIDYSGVTHQAVASTCSLAGDSRPILVAPTSGLTETPVARSFYYPIGTNLIVRAEALASVGGFDEQYDYYHDETDLARRLLDAGWIVRPLPRGHVFHKFLPSDIRGERRIATDRRSIVVNRAYFAARHQAPRDGADRVRIDFAAFADAQVAELVMAQDADLIPAGSVERFLDDRAHAATLLERWLIAPPTPRRHTPDPASVLVDRPSVQHVEGSSSLHVAMITPAATATATAMLSLARRLTEAGCRVHVVEHGTSHSTVDLEEGIWRHRLAPGPGVDLQAGHVPPTTELVDEVVRTAQEVATIDVLVVDRAAGDPIVSSLPVVDAADLARLSSVSEMRDLLQRCRLGTA